MNPYDYLKSQIGDMHDSTVEAAMKAMCEQKPAEEPKKDTPKDGIKQTTKPVTTTKTNK